MGEGYSTRLSKWSISKGRQDLEQLYAIDGHSLDCWAASPWLAAINFNLIISASLVHSLSKNLAGGWQCSTPGDSSMNQKKHSSVPREFTSW